MFDVLDIVALIIFLICFAGYHSAYFILTERYPHKSVKAYIKAFREKELEYLLSKGDYETLIQQLRDAINVSNIFASASLIFVGMILNLLINLKDIAESLKIVNVEMFEFKVLFVAAIQAVSFIFFVSSLRYYRMVSLLAATPPQTVKELLGIEAHKYFAQLLEKGCSFYTLGSRGLLYSIFLLAWFVNTWMFIAIVVIATALFARYRDFMWQEV